MKLLAISDAHDEQIYIDKIKDIYMHGNYDAALVLEDLIPDI